MKSLSEILIIISGIYSLVFAIFHLLFWWIFHWKKGLASLSLVNRAITQILNLCLAFVLFVMACVSLLYIPELLQTALGKFLLFSFSIFWFLRMIEQVIFFKAKNPASIIFTVIFLLGTIIYLIPALYASS